MTNLPFQNSNPAHTGFQYLEDLATAYWYSEVLFTSIRLKLFDYLHTSAKDLDRLARVSCCNRKALLRLLRALKKIELVQESDGHWYNSQASRKYLVSSSDHFLGDFLLYRRYMKSGWETLLDKLTDGHKEYPQPFTRNTIQKEDYTHRNFNYVRTMDLLAREKAREIVSIIPNDSWQPPILDIGGGAGALCRAIRDLRSECETYLFDLPEVIQAARKIYPGEDAWHHIHTISGDFRRHVFSPSQKFGLILMGNFLHAYGREEAQKLLEKALTLLLPDGLVVVHDYFPDFGRPPYHKGAFYDLNMLLNTYDGQCHNIAEITRWLKAGGMTTIWRKPLRTDSALILAAGPLGRLPMQDNDELPQVALSLGFRNAVELTVDKIVVAAWVREKCRSGCSAYGQKLQCPPHCIALAETQALLNSYTRALLVEDAPPGKAFHEKLLALERNAFLSGYHQALVFGAGPCPVCTTCPEDGICRRPEKARPSMEGAGINVYATVRNGGLSIKPVPNKGSYVKYFGLLLLE